MKISSLFASFALIGFATLAGAQEPSPPAKEQPPDPPLMDSAPPDSQWTITYNPKTPVKEPVTEVDIRNTALRRRYSPTLLSKNVLKSATGQVVVYTTYEAGIKSEGWVIGGYFYEMPTRPGQSVRVDPKGKGDFPEVYWITAENFRGTVEYKGAKVHLYETVDADLRQDPSLPAPLKNDPAAKVRPRRAYIDAKTRLPVAADIGASVLTYQFAGAPASFPVPDEKVKRIMRDAGMKKQ